MAKKDKKKAVKRPDRVRVVPHEVSDKYSDYPSQGLNPIKLARIFREADAGDVRAQMELFEEVEEKDTHISSQMQTRKLAVTELDWNIQAASGEEADKAVADFVEEQMKHIFTESDIMTDMLDAIGKGISVSEIIWGADVYGHNIIDRVDWIHPKKLVWDSMTDELKICTTEHPEGMELIKNKFVVHRYKARSGHASRAGLLRSVTWMYLFKNYTLKDWVSFCEVFGMPLRLGKYDPNASEDDKAALMEALVSLGTDAAGITPNTTEITFVESNKLSSAEIYEKLARYCDEQNSKAILGQTLTADSGGGSYAQGKVHSEVRHDLTKADANALAITIKRDLIAPLVYYNFGPDVKIPDFQFDAEDPEDLKDTAEIYRTLACDLRLPIPEKHVYKKFAIPEPEEGERVLQIPETSGQVPVSEPLQDLKAFKARGEPEEQEQIDRMAEFAVQQAGEAFRRMMSPLLKAVEDAESLGALKETLKDTGELEKLYLKMDTDGLEELMRQGLYLAEAVGRTME